MRNITMRHNNNATHTQPPAEYPSPEGRWSGEAVSLGIEAQSSGTEMVRGVKRGKSLYHLSKYTTTRYTTHHHHTDWAPYRGGIGYITHSQRVHLHCYMEQFNMMMRDTGSVSS